MTKIQWNVTCNVADNTVADGTVNHCEDLRFELAPKDDGKTSVEEAKKFKMKK